MKKLNVKEILFNIHYVAILTFILGVTAHGVITTPLNHNPHDMLFYFGPIYGIFILLIAASIIFHDLMFKYKFETYVEIYIKAIMRNTKRGK